MTFEMTFNFFRQWTICKFFILLLDLLQINLKMGWQNYLITLDADEFRAAICLCSQHAFWIQPSVVSLLLPWSTKMAASKNMARARYASCSGKGLFKYSITFRTWKSKLNMKSKQTKCLHSETKKLRNDTIFILTGPRGKIKVKKNLIQF